MNLTKHFTLSELCNSETAARKGLDNHPTDETISQLKYTCAGLERIRQITNAAIVVTSGYRSPAVNQAIGGKVTSQHCKGEAALKLFFSEKNDLKKLNDNLFVYKC